MYKPEISNNAPQAKIRCLSKFVNVEIKMIDNVLTSTAIILDMWRDRKSYTANSWN